MKMSALIVVAILMSAANAEEKPTKEQLEASAKKIKELRKQRIDTLQTAADVSLKLAQSARLEISEAMETRIALHKAQLDAAEKPSDRLIIYKWVLESLQELEELAKARKVAARGTELAVLQVRAKRLEIEIALEQEKLKEAK
ncbi:MAG: hypothetical protein K8U57_18885 [Planctomycetes bacterium]|nr:hypothetical protein [Planctomycetota bacterium]